MDRLNFLRPITLHVSLPFGKTIALAGVILLALLGIGEAFCRTSWARDRLVAPSLDINFDTLDVKIDLLAKLADREPIDCIFIGSSMVNRGINIEVFEKVFNQQTGESITCFNLGLGGVRASEAAALVDYVMATYHPALLIYGFSPRDFVFSPEREGPGIVESTWIGYARGTFSVKGWLLHHSYLYRYALEYNTWMLPDFDSQIKERRRKMDELAATRGQTIVNPPDEPLAPPNISQTAYVNYKPSPAKLDDLQSIINYHRPPEQQVVLVEIPMYPVLLTDHLGVGPYQSLMDDITRRASLQGVPFWPTSQLGLIPVNGWQDSQHLSIDGAKVFSQWLAQQISSAVREGQLVSFSSESQQR
jgi:hypothetical protein